MLHPPVSAIEVIQAILAPALGVSAVGLLLLALYNRYSSIMNRIRLLNEERRRYMKLLAEDTELSYTDNTRYMSINNQMKELLLRSRLVRNAILSMQVAIGLFVLTSVAIGANLVVESGVMQLLPMLFFIVGMLTVFAGVVFAGLEIQRSYKIILLETSAD
jgi:Protein of unknown function (DUF2721)